MNLIEVYQDTLDYSKHLLNSNTTKHNFSEILKNQLKTKTNIEVVNSDSVSALTKWSKVGKTAVLNMASHKRPGGGVINGARAQEECLFRCSNLGHVISTDFYPLQDDELLWTKDAVFFKDVSYGYMKDVQVDVVTIAAINLNGLGKFQKMPNYEELTKNKIRLMFSMAIKNNIDNLILGAWGCGVFGNEPNKMAKMFMDVINEGYSFDNIIFAIINDHNSVGNNYNEFKRVVGV
jgi:uncharacterized protein (TIGR02452 family)